LSSCQTNYHRPAIEDLDITPAMSVTDLKEGAGAPSPRSFAIAHQRPKSSFVGCSQITDYEILDKLGEGTFG
jgi:serine/threonine-protein kinase BUR1